MIIIDLEIVTLICLIIILIYNYYTNDCYRLKKQKQNCYNKNIEKDLLNINNHFTNNISTYDNMYDRPVSTKHQQIELSGFSNDKEVKKTDNDPSKIPDNVILNDRYNDFITSYTDEQLSNVITELPSNVFSSEYSQSLIDDLQKNIIFDVDTKAYTKSKATQKLAKDSATIASRFGRNSLLDSYKNELDEYEKDRTPWWSEADDTIISYT